MDYILTLLAILLVVALGIAWFLGKAVLKGAGDEAGRQVVQRLAAVWTQRKGHRRSRRVARRGGIPSAVLRAAGNAELERAFERLHTLTSPTPDAAALLRLLYEEDAPFEGRTAVIVFVGPGAQAYAKTTLEQTGRDVVHATFGVTSPTTPDEASNSASFWSQLDTVLDSAHSRASEIPSGFVAIVIRPPLTGSWASEDTINPQLFINTVLDRATPDVWLTITDPAREGAWPPTVTVTLPVELKVMRRALARVGYILPADATVTNNAVSLPGSDAALLVAALTDLQALQILGNAETPAYGPALTLALDDLEPGWVGTVRTNDAESRARQGILRTAGVRILASPTADVELKLPLSFLPRRTVGWRLGPRLTADPITQSHEVAAASGYQPMTWLRDAIGANDESIAATILADHGRAWLELSDIRSALAVIESAHNSFNPKSRAFLWSHYLLALDSALRREDPSARWFTADLCEFADATELGLLFRAERMEFRRLRGDLAGAVTEANALITSLRTRDVDRSSDQYVAGTSRYVLANLLRRGGRYDLARDLILEAKNVLDDGVPAHRIELTHTEYGLSVCDSMFGVASVRMSDGWSASEAVFGRSLVTLANSHASWFVKDYERAAEFAALAGRGFSSISFVRYATRSANLRLLIEDWARRSGQPVQEETVGKDERVELLLGAPEGSHIEWLNAERPSSVMSLLQFAVTFGSADVPRVIDLPQLIGSDPDGALVLYQPPPASSFRDAETTMRSGLGIGQGTRVPLAVD